MVDANLLDQVLRAKRVYLIGNGGSFANAVHICNDLLLRGIKAYTIDPASLTASANDYGYETVFSRWIATVGEKGDLLIALSGSGKSPNILLAIAEAEARGMEVYRMFGCGKNMQDAENEQLVMGHEVYRELAN